MIYRYIIGMGLGDGIISIVGNWVKGGIGLLGLSTPYKKKLLASGFFTQTLMTWWIFCHLWNYEQIRYKQRWGSDNILQGHNSDVWNNWQWLFLQPPRVCDVYWSEFRHCKSLWNRFHHYYTYGTSPSCRQWKEDYYNCKEWEKQPGTEAKVQLHEISQFKD